MRAGRPGAASRGLALRPALALALLLLGLSAGPAAGQQVGAAPDGAAMTLAEIEDEIARREADLERYGERLQVLEGETARLRTELEGREDELRGREHQVRARIVTLCRLRQGGYLHLLRGAGSMAELVRTARFARALAAHELALLREHQGEVGRLAAERAGLERRLDEQRELREHLAAYRDELAAERDRRAAAAGLGGLEGDFDPVLASPSGSAPSPFIDL